MSQHIRDRIQRKLVALSDERLYQVLDFVEFLELKYPAAQPATATNPLQRFADGVEDRLRAGGIAVSTVSEAMGFLNKAVGVLGNVATAAQTAAQRVGDTVTEVAQSVQATAQAPTRAGEAAGGPTAGGPTAGGPPVGGPAAGGAGAAGTGPATTAGGRPGPGPLDPPISGDRPQ